MPKRAQIAIEFLVLTAISFFFLAGILVVLSVLSSQNADMRRQAALDDLGSSLKNEFSIASEMENGYHRELNLPKKISGRNYNITLEEGISGMSYLVISAPPYERYYTIPESWGTIDPGRNIIIKNENNITVSYIG